MPVFTPYDDQFNDREHSELGQRNFSVSHAKKDGVVMAVISVCLLVAACVLFAMVKRYELFALYGALAAFLGLFYNIDDRFLALKLLLLPLLSFDFTFSQCYYTQILCRI